jgi:hypothetical protein
MIKQGFDTLTYLDLGFGKLMRVLVHPLGTTLQEDKKRVAVISFI